MAGIEFGGLAKLLAHFVEQARSVVAEPNEIGVEFEDLELKLAVFDDLFGGTGHFDLF